MPRVRKDGAGRVRGGKGRGCAVSRDKKESRRKNEKMLERKAGETKAGTSKCQGYGRMEQGGFAAEKEENAL